VQQKLAKFEAVLPAYAESIGLPYLDLSDIPLSPQLIARVPPMIARRHSCVPVMIDDKQLLVASPNPIDPNVEEELRLRFDMPVRTVLCTPANIDAVMRDGSAVEPAPVPEASAETAAPATADAPQPAEKVQPTGPLTPEELQERKNYAIVTFNLTVMGCMGALVYGLGWGVLVSATLALPLAAIAAGIVWKSKSR